MGVGGPQHYMENFRENLEAKVKVADFWSDYTHYKVQLQKETEDNTHTHTAPDLTLRECTSRKCRG